MSDKIDWFFVMVASRPNSRNLVISSEMLLAQEYFNYFKILFDFVFPYIRHAKGGRFC